MSGTLPRLPSNLPISQNADGSLSPIQTEAINANLPDYSYFAIEETISADKQYAVPFEGHSMIFYSDKPVILRVNSQSNDAIPLMANIGIKFDKMKIDSVFVQGVSSPTAVKVVVTGK